MAAETQSVRYKIDDQQFEFPELDDLQMEEWELLYEYAGLILDDFAPLEDEKEEAARRRRVNQPAFTRAMLHIAYRRANPDAADNEIREIARTARLIRHLEAIGEGVSEEGDESPPESTTKPAPSSPRSFVDSPASGSSGSTKSSAEPASQPAAIGTSG